MFRTVSIAGAGLLMCGLARPNSSETSTTSWWIGRGVTHGHRDLPIIGRVETRIDSYFVAQVTRDREGVRVEQKLCASTYTSGRNTTIAFNVGKLPPQRSRLQRDPERDRLTSILQWRTRDVDHDGQPGMTVRVDAPMCKGRMHIGDRTKMSMRGRMDAHGFRGRLEIEHEIEILDADSLCLRFLPKRRRERGIGHFEFIEATGRPTCSAAIAHDWAQTRAAKEDEARPPKPASTGSGPASTLAPEPVARSTDEARR